MPVRPNAPLKIRSALVGVQMLPVVTRVAAGEYSRLQVYEVHPPIGQSPQGHGTAVSLPAIFLYLTYLKTAVSKSGRRGNAKMLGDFASLEWPESSWFEVFL